MTNTVDVSVIIPVYNCEKYIETAISSALNQIGVNVEVIAVDDGSSDDSLTLLRKFGNSVKVFEQKNQGACVARNVGIKHANGRFIKFLDSDDYLLPSSLKNQFSNAFSLIGNQFSYGRSFRHIETSGKIIPHSSRDANYDNKDSLSNLLMDPPVISAIMYPSQLISEVGGFDVRLNKRQDYDLFARSIIAGFKPVACNVPTFCYRSHDNCNRISFINNKTAYSSQAEMFERQVKALLSSAIVSKDSDVRNGLARTIWVTARNSLRAGYKKEARVMFDLSYKLSRKKGQEGNFVYKILVDSFGPFFAEKLISKVKKYV